MDPKLRPTAAALVGFALLLASGCASTSSNAADETEKDFELAGWRVIGCCCTPPCPCRINKLPTHCHGCDATTAVYVERGHVGDVELDGLSWVVAVRALGLDPSSNWTYGYVDEKATDDQFAAIQKLIEDKVARRYEKSPALAGKLVGIRRVPMTCTRSLDHPEYSVTIPGILEFKTRAHVNPGMSKPVVSTGIFDDFGDSFVHADTLVHRYDDPETGFHWDLAGRQSNQAKFALDDERLARGGIGWGCWSAHAELGGKERYVEELASGHP